MVKVENLVKNYGLKYGSEKSRIALFLVFGILAVLLFGVKNVSIRLNPSNAALERLAKALDGMPPAAVLAALSAVCVLAAYNSYLCSVRIMEKKEF